MNASDFFKERLNVHKSQLLNNRLQDSFTNQMIKNMKHSNYSQKGQESYRQTNLKGSAPFTTPNLLAPYKDQFITPKFGSDKKIVSNVDMNSNSQNYYDLRSLKQKIKKRI